MKFQIVLTDRQDFILEHKTFYFNPSNDLSDMLEYLAYAATMTNCSVIKITKWDSKGNRI